eukprot:scaffold7978_cov124-Cylindrotheca_fusiformis.AAC.1
MQPIYDTGDTTAINVFLLHWLDFFKNSQVVLRSAGPRRVIAKNMRQGKTRCGFLKKGIDFT